MRGRCPWTIAALVVLGAAPRPTVGQGIPGPSGPIARPNGGPAGPGLRFAAPYGPTAMTPCPHGGHRTRRGLARCQARVLGYPEEFNEWPLGWSVYAHNQAQVANGQAASMTFYDYDFLPDSDHLNGRGRDKLSEVAGLLPVSFAPVVVERVADPALGEARRLQVAGALAAGGFPVPLERVLVGRPAALGLSGAEARLTTMTLYQQTLTRGAFGAPAGPTGGSGLDSGGLSGAVGGDAGAGGAGVGP